MTSPSRPHLLLLCLCSCVFVVSKLVYSEGHLGWITTSFIQQLLTPHSSGGSQLSPTTTYPVPRDLDPPVTGSKIAIGLAITTRSVRKVTLGDNLRNYPFYTSFLPSFCQTVSSNHRYYFYLAHDLDDVRFNTPSFRESWVNHFINYTNANCPRTSLYFITLIQCNYTGKPAWSQNEAMMAGYRDNMDYYYRVNDDTVLKTSDWTEDFIRILLTFDPANVGVVGPRHRGGNAHILTYDFVHQRHLAVFGYYYPRAFPHWWADYWMTYVYRPRRSVMVTGHVVWHTQEHGRRYQPQEVDQRVRDKVILEGREVLQR